MNCRLELFLTNQENTLAYFLDVSQETEVIKATFFF